MFTRGTVLYVDLGRGQVDVVRIVEVDVKAETYYTISLKHNNLHGEIYFDQDNVHPMPWTAWDTKAT